MSKFVVGDGLLEREVPLRSYIRDFQEAKRLDRARENAQSRARERASLLDVKTADKLAYRRENQALAEHYAAEAERRIATKAAPVGAVLVAKPKRKH